MDTGTAHTYWVHNLSPFLVEFHNGLGIRYYGLAYLLAFVIADRLLNWYWHKGRSVFSPELRSGFMIAIILGVLVGGRLGFFLLYTPEALWSDPLSLLKIWHGGMASHGGFVGVCVAVIWFVRKHHLGWRKVADEVVTLAPAGLMLGRLANFVNGELWGRVSYVPWAVIFPASAPEGTPISQIPPRHPSQIYEALLEGLFLLLYTQWRFWRTAAPRTSPGRLAGEFLILYAIVRIIGEFFREPDAPLLLGLSRGMFYSVFLILGGLVLVVSSRRPRAVQA